MQICNLKSLNFKKDDNITFSAKPIPENVLKKLESRMLKADNIDIFCHTSPDEDTVNSAKVIANLLLSLNKKVRIFADGKLNGIFLDNSYKLNIYDPVNLKSFEKADLAVVVDFNSKTRVSKPGGELLNKYQIDEIVGLDHHQHTSSEELIGNINTEADNPFYIDSSAKSCCGVIYRFFEGLGKKLDENNLGNLYCGMIDDLMKSGCVNIESNNGNYKLKRTKSISNDPYTVEVLDKIEDMLPKQRQKEILKHLDILSRLTDEAKAFQKRLFKEVKITENGKLAYVVLPPEDKEWIVLGQDNNITSKILLDFRKRLLKNRPDDEFISDDLRANLVNVKAVAVFYRGAVTEVSSKEVYKVSIHSAGEMAKELVHEVLKSNKAVEAGGHKDRVGGKIHSIDEQDCKRFVKSFVDAAEKE